MTESNYYSEADHGPHEIFELGDYLLESGVTLPNAKIAFNSPLTKSLCSDSMTPQ